MAIALEDKTNVDPPSALYPNGQIRDNPGDGSGTPVDKSVYADFHQFFARLLVEAGITPNGEYENAYTGFQYIEALIDSSIAWLTTGITFAADWSASVNFGYKKTIRRTIKLRGRIVAGVTKNSGDLAFTLPVGYRPLVEQNFVISGQSQVVGPYIAWIQTDGKVSILEVGVAPGSPMTVSGTYLDGIEFERAEV